MKLSLIIFILLVVTFNVKAAESSGEKVYQMEAGFFLREDLALEILGRYKMKSEKRTDLYFNQYDGKSFLMSNDAENFKFRLKVKQDAAVIQAGTREAIHQKKCPTHIVFNVKEKLVGEYEISSKKSNELLKLGQIIPELLIVDASDEEIQDQLKTRVNYFQREVLKINVPLKDEVLSPGEGKKWILVPSYYSQKTKWKAKIAKSPSIKFSITKANDYIGRQFIQTRYEVEFQQDSKNDLSVDEFSGEVCHFMEKLNPSKEQLTPDRLNTEAEMLKRLELHPELLDLVP